MSQTSTDEPLNQNYMKMYLLKKLQVKEKAKV